ncbi:MAG: hypothetical protein RJA99_4263 [Pseudomonadota bacterium]|jgi:hypothetical protein
MSKKTVDDLREHLFATLEGLRDGTMPVDKARAISEVAQTIINSARVEVEAARLAESTDVPRFLDGDQAESLPPGITGVVRHRLAG